MIYVLIIIFFLFSIVAFFSPKEKLPCYIFFGFFWLLLIFVAGFRDEGVDRDYSSYVVMFKYFDTITVEPSFVLISYIIHTFISPNSIFLFIIFAILGVSLKLFALKQLTELWFLSLVIYCSNFFILHELTQIRVGVAAGFLLLCIKPIYERDWKRFVLFAALAFSFHYSALVILPLWFLGLNPRKLWLLFSIPFAYLIYFSGINLIVFIPITNIQEKLEVYKQLQDIGDEQWNSINVFNLLFLARIMIFYFLLFKYEQIVFYNKYAPLLMKIYCLSLITFPIFAIMPVVGFRISELYGISEIILFPLLYYAFKPILISRAIVIFIGINLMYIILFYSKIITF